MRDKEILDLYIAGHSIREIEKQVFHCRRYIRKVLKLNGFEKVRIDNKKRKYSLKHNYFEIIDTPIKAYFLGWMYSDGFTLKDGYCSGINLASDDRMILEKFAEETFGTKEAVYDLKKNRCKPQSRLIFKSREFQKHLIAQGVIHNKSLTLLPPLNISDEFKKYFILGFFEGDGCFSSFALSMTGTKPVLEWIGKEFEKIGVIKYRIFPAQNQITHRFTMCGRNNIKLVYDFLYKNNSLFLLRKKQKIEDYLSKYFTAFQHLGNCSSRFQEGHFELHQE